MIVRARDVRADIALGKPCFEQLEGKWNNFRKA